MTTHSTSSSVVARTFALFALLALIVSAVPAQAQVPAECVALTEGTWADAVEGSALGQQKDNAAITGDRADTSNALGPQDWTEGDETGFVALGFAGSIELRFDEFVQNVPGDDLTVYEATNDPENSTSTYPLEVATVEVSQNGTDWESIGEAVNNGNSDRTTAFDFDSTSFDWIRYVRLIDNSDESLHSDDADGFDVDAVFAESAACDEPGNNEGSITITKVYGVDGDWSFDFTGTGDLSFELTNTNTSEIFLAEAGVYTFAEVLGTSTNLQSITCTGGATAAVASTTLGTVDVTLAADEDIACTFTNRPDSENGGGGDDDSDDLTCSLVTNDDSVNRNEEFTLSWTTTNADTITIDNGIGAVTATGSVVTSIDNDTTFTLTATASTSATTTDTIQCTVNVERRSSGGGGGTRVGQRNNDNNDGGGGGGGGDDDDTPPGQVLGEQVSVVPQGAPATGAGGTAPFTSYAYFGTALFTRIRGLTQNR